MLVHAPEEPISAEGTLEGVRWFQGVVAVTLMVGCQPSANRPPEPQPARRGQITARELEKLSLAPDEIHVSYLGAIRYPDHARFTWRIVAGRGFSGVSPNQLSGSEAGLAAYDLQLIFVRNSAKKAWMETRLEPVAILEASGQKRSVTSLSSTRWTPLATVPEDSALDTVGRVQFRKAKTVKRPFALELVRLEVDDPSIPNRVVTFKLER